MGKSPAFQLYASDFDMDTASWDNEEVGIYFRLLMYQWVNGSVPSDLKRLSKIARMSTKKFQNRWEIISSKFKENGNNDLVNLRMEKTREEQYNYKKSQSDAGKKGIEIKREKGIYPFKQPLKQPLKQPYKPKSSSSSSSSSSIKNKENILKEKFLDFVFLTIEENEKLISKFGETGTKEWIERLNEYVGSKGKKYKSHYHTILMWANKENRRGGKNDDRFNF